MKARTIEFCHGACHGACKSRGGRARGAVGGAMFALLVALMPKCPICIAAWLGVLGLSGLAARVDPRAVWLAMALAISVLGTAVVHQVLGRGDTTKGDEI